MVNYSNAVIYTIRTGDSVYVGSTCNFKNRKWQHKYSLTTETAKSYNFKLYKTIRENDGEWIMKPYKLFSCQNKTQLEIEEERCRVELNADLNSCFCHGKNKEKENEHKKKFYEKNKDKYYERNKQYREQNKEQSAEYMKQYREQNKEKIDVSYKKYYEHNKEKLSQKITCECGCVVNNSSLSQHKKTNKHFKLLEAKQQNIKED